MLTGPRTVSGQTLDEIAWRFYGKTTGCVELILEANPNLSKQPTILPSGLIIQLPDIPASLAFQGC
ncbi:tail protein X [Spartinivicinus ruber]|uniref:tail protein X n=1 Tax=Spartinivicinus ruber TaxID=2683272 RepID=UPI0013D66FE5|nr:tail protein X [Spartinivicinus ruber]